VGRSQARAGGSESHNGYEALNLFDDGWKGRGGMQMRTQFKFENADQLMDFVRLTHCERYDMALLVALLDLDSEEDYRYAAWCSEAAYQEVFR
jgi:hypothetical protein